MDERRRATGSRAGAMGTLVAIVVLALSRLASAGACTSAENPLLAHLQEQAGFFQPTEAALSGPWTGGRAGAFRPADAVAFAELAARIDASAQVADPCSMHALVVLKAVEGHPSDALVLAEESARARPDAAYLENDVAVLEWESKGRGSGLLRFRAIDRWVRLAMLTDLPEAPRNLALVGARLGIDSVRSREEPPTRLSSGDHARVHPYDSTEIANVVAQAREAIHDPGATRTISGTWATFALGEVAGCARIVTCRTRARAGLDLLDQGNTALAGDELRVAASRYGDAATELSAIPSLARVATLQLAKSRANAGDVAVAYDIFVALLGPGPRPSDPTVPWANKHLGVAAMILGRPREAFGRLDAALLAFERSADAEGRVSASVAKADLLRSTGRITEAADLLFGAMIADSGSVLRPRLAAFGVEILGSTPLDAARGLFASHLAAVASASDPVLQAWGLLTRTTSWPPPSNAFVDAVDRSVAETAGFADLGQRMRGERAFARAKSLAETDPAGSLDLARFVEATHDTADRRTESRLLQARALRRLGRPRDALALLEQALAHADAASARTPPVPDRQGRVDPVRQLYTEAMAAAAEDRDWALLFRWADAFSEFSVMAMARVGQKPVLPARLQLPPPAEVFLRVERLTGRYAVVAASSTGVHAVLVRDHEGTPASGPSWRPDRRAVEAESPDLLALLVGANRIVPLSSALSPGAARWLAAELQPSAVGALEARSTGRWASLGLMLREKRKWAVAEGSLAPGPTRRPGILLFDGHFSFDPEEPLDSYFSRTSAPGQPTVRLRDLGTRIDTSVVALLACDTAARSADGEELALTPARAILASGGLAVVAAEDPIPDSAARAYREALLAALRNDASFCDAHAAAAAAIRRHSTSRRSSLVLWL